MAGVRLEFAQFGHFDYFNIYRNSVSTAIENLGQLIGTSSTMYYEDLTVEPNRDYYYRIGVVRNSIEEFSGEFHVTATTATHPVLSLFKNSEKGLWLDFTDMSSTYQDVAGLNPVTAVSQPIGKVLDKTGNGNHAAKNSVSAPTFTADGAFFNGYQQMLQTINQLNFGLSTNVEVFLQVKTLSGSSYGFILETGLTYNENAGGFTTLSPEEADAIRAGFTVSTSSSQNVINAHKGTGLYSGAYSLRITDTEFTLDVPGINTYTKAKPSVPVATNYLNIGARVSNQSFRFIGYIKHIVIVNRQLTASERSNLYAFLNT